MKQILYTSILFIFATFQSYAQEIKWSIPVISQDFAGVWDVIEGPAGVYYLSGYYWGEVTVGGVVLEHVGVQDFFIAKYNSNGSLIWIKSYGGIGNDRCSTLELDPSGDLFIGGIFSESLEIQGAEIFAQGDRDIFVARFSPEGELIWVNSFGGEGYEQCFDLEYTGEELLVTGQFEEIVDFDVSILLSAGNSDAYILSLDPEEGEAKWVTSIGGSGGERFYSIATNQQGEIAAFGYFNSTIEIVGETYSSTAGLDPILIKFDETGLPLWAVNMESPLFGSLGRDVVFDEGGNLYLSGSFGGTLTMGNNTLDGYDPEVGDAFLISLFPDGEWRWGQSLKTSSNTFGGNLFYESGRLIMAASLSNGTSFNETSLFGFSGSAAGVFEFDVQGNLKKTTTFDGPNDDGALPVILDGNDILVGLQFTQNIFIGNEEIIGGGEIDGLLVRFNPEDPPVSTKESLDFLVAAKTNWVPAQSTLELELLSNDIQRVSIFSMDGKLIGQQNAAPFMTFNLSNIASGVVIVRLHHPDGLIARRVPIFR